MSRICAVCGKKPHVGNIVSHANNRTKKWIYPNVHKIRFSIVKCQDNKVYHDKVCTRCVKAGKIKKVI